MANTSYNYETPLANPWTIDKADKNELTDNEYNLLRYYGMLLTEAITGNSNYKQTDKRNSFVDSGLYLNDFQGLEHMGLIFKSIYKSGERIIVSAWDIETGDNETLVVIYW